MERDLLASLYFVSLALFHMAGQLCWRGISVSTAVRQHIENRTIVQQEGDAQAWYLYILEVV